ncbi:thiamine-phosphate kinase [Larsenimonas salina]|uniref:thiamine-phosphate kinase n=1 Tax=Larsenimonas salina TaxID=1295565 RepID=UPI002072EEE4|nr:thiamine-phosphate kinase [Larsenimonas salina]MCM5704902.1 thiamine-phosphate kinase [Larsenimonas salina]
MTSPGEFELIQRHVLKSLSGERDGYDRFACANAGVELGPGDDGALLVPTPGHRLVVSTDTSNVDVHFPADAPAHAIGHRALAVNLSDLAAMGATPRWFTLALTLPEADTAWVDAFAEGLHALAHRQGIVLVGGDITRGPLSIAITVMGEVPIGQALVRHGGADGDHLLLTGPLGGANAGLKAWQRGERDCKTSALAAYLYPVPRTRLGERLRTCASTAIDLSDGLWADLSHVCRASGLGAELSVPDSAYAPSLASLDANERSQAFWHGGDDYELLVSVAPARLGEAHQAAAALGHELIYIGKLSARTNAIDGGPDNPGGWRHFGETS